ncbi:MAG: hypothetical protein AMXMBFR84_04250 [Candidatus Hydrogenedentota bacterium]
MKRFMPFAAEAALYALAFAAPWAVYATIPTTSVSLESGLTAAITLLAFLDLARSQRLRVPFEFTWPVVALLGVAWADAYLTREPWPLRITSLSLLFVSVIQLVRGPACVRECLRLTALAGGGVALASILSRAGYLVPTVALVDGQLPASLASRELQGIFRLPYLASPQSWPQGFASLFLGMICGLGFMGMRNNTHRARLRAAVDVGLPAFVIATSALWIKSAIREWAPSPVEPLDPEAWVQVGIIAWIVARVAAKLEADRRETHSGFHGVLQALLITLVLAAAFYPNVVGPAHVFLLALAAAYACPHPQTPPWSGRAALAGTLPVFALVIVNALVVNPSNLSDPRNFSAAIQADLEKDMPEVALNRIRLWESFDGDGRAIALSRSRIALAQDQPILASIYFTDACAARISDQPGMASAAIGQPDKDAYVRAFRAWQPEVGADGKYNLALARVLIAAGDRDGALSWLEAHTEPLPVPAGIQDTAAIAYAAARLLLAPDLKEDLSEWPLERLMGLLRSWGAHVEPPPEGFPKKALPLAAWGQITQDAFEFGVAAGECGSTASLAGPVRPSDWSGTVEESDWLWTRDESAEYWDAQFFVSEGGVRRVFGDIGVAGNCDLRQQGGGPGPNLAPIDPFIRVLLP